MGETPKNVAAIFRAAREEGAVLLFDEADAIASRRSTSIDHGFQRSPTRSSASSCRNWSGTTASCFSRRTWRRTSIRRSSGASNARDVRDASAVERERILARPDASITHAAGRDVDFRSLAERHAVSAAIYGTPC